jgi:hypothetical protein
MEPQTNDAHDADDQSVPEAEAPGADTIQRVAQALEATGGASASPSVTLATEAGDPLPPRRGG